MYSCRISATCRPCWTAAAYARAKNIDPAILLNLRLAPNMYQVADTAAIDFVRSLPRAEINRAGDKEVVFTFKNGATRKFTGRSLLLMFSVPQFFFQVTTAYAILRHAGVVSPRRTFWGRLDKHERKRQA